MLCAANLVAADATRQSSPKAMAKACGLTDSGQSSAPYDDEGETYLLIRQAFCAAFDELIKQVILHPAPIPIKGFTMYLSPTRGSSRLDDGHAGDAMQSASVCEAQRQGGMLLLCMSSVDNVLYPNRASTGAAMYRHGRRACIDEAQRQGRTLLLYVSPMDTLETLAR